MPSQASKNDIRRDALTRRDAIPADVRANSSLSICRAVSEDDLFLDSNGIHVYLPIGSEVDIRPLIELAWEMGKEVGMMRVMDDGGIAQYSITPSTRYNVTKLGIMEPLDAEPFDMDICDLVIVPVVAADEYCNRLGYGKGYYDQFLAHHPRPTLGVAFEEQMVAELPVDDLDIQLDGIYTERRFIEA
ncbi:MAG TPA: 5-formyltetrahydrofolate cyclo-ligase [Candidatus Kapabacteria bacterium]|nr:5-formyltetrahydrofolate cyclo-ligase [Candidatus Kapabacteria bacterium]